MSTKPRGSEPRLRAARVVLDTSAYSRFRAGNEAIAAILSRATTVSLPLVVLGELEAGFALGARASDNRASLDELLAEPFVSVLPITREITIRYGRLFAALRRAGTPVGTNDLWIAATAIEHDGHLVTFDGDYAKIPGLGATILKS